MQLIRGVAPIRALDYDVEKPLHQLADAAAKRGLSMTITETDVEHVDHVAGRTGIVSRSISSIVFEVIGD